MLTKFRGFYQFGVMAAFGVLFCWALTFTVLPAIFFLMDRRTSAKKQSRARAPMNLAFLGRWINRRPWRHRPRGCCAHPVLWRGPAAFRGRALRVRLPQAERQPTKHRGFEAVQPEHGEAVRPLALAHHRAGGQRSAKSRPSGRHLAQDKAEHVIGQIVTINDVLPGTAEVQTRKLALLHEIRKLTHDPAIEAMNDKERKQIAQIDIPAGRFAC
jgi:hypothetical protein